MLLAPPTTILKRLAPRWQRLPLAARICLVIWIAVGTLGLLRFAAAIPSAIQAARMGDDGQRRAIWAPAYGFAAACASQVAPGTSLLLVDPTDPANFYDHRPYDQRNLGVFAYILYPHLVTPLGVVAPDWTPSAARTDYIALWEQSVDRSQSMQAIAHATERKVQQALPGQLVCTYTGADNARGVLFAVSARARAALAGSHGASASGSGAQTTGQPTSSFGTLGAYLLALMGLASLWLIGLVALLVFPRGTVSVRLGVALAFPLGCLGVALELLATSLVGIPWSAVALGLPWLGLAALALWRHRALLLTPGGAQRAWSGALRALRAPTRWRLALDERIALGTLAAVGLAASMSAPAELPILDGFSFYYFRALAFFHDRSIVPYYQHASTLLFSAPAHPPLVSLCVAWLYLWLGQVSEHATLLWWPASFLSLLAGFYALARSAVSRRLALWSTLSLALIGFPGHILGGTLPWQMFDTAAVASLVVGWADMPLTVFLLAGCGLLWRWAVSERRQPATLLLAGLFLGGAALTKEEGLTAACIALAASPLLIIWRGWESAELQPRGSWWRPLAWSAPGFVVSALPLLLLRVRYPIPDFRILISPAVLLQNLIASIAGFGVWIVAYWPAPLALIAAWVLQRRSRRAPLAPLLSGRLLLLACVVVGQVAIDMASIATISVNAAEVNGELHTAVSRLLMQLLPLIFLGTLALWPDLLARHDTPGGPAPEPDTTEQDAAPAAQIVAGLPI